MVELMDIFGEDIFSENYKAGSKAVSAAKKGDFGEIAERLRDKSIEITLTEREFVASILLGEHKKKPRPSD